MAAAGLVKQENLQNALASLGGKALTLSTENDEGTLETEARQNRHRSTNRIQQLNVFEAPNIRPFRPPGQ